MKSIEFPTMVTETGKFLFTYTNIPCFLSPFIRKSEIVNICINIPIHILQWFKNTSGFKVIF